MNCVPLLSALVTYECVPMINKRTDDNKDKETEVDVGACNVYIGPINPSGIQLVRIRKPDGSELRYEGNFTLSSGEHDSK